MCVITVHPSENYDWINMSVQIRQEKNRTVMWCSTSIHFWQVSTVVLTAFVPMVYQPFPNIVLPVNSLLGFLRTNPRTTTDRQLNLWPLLAEVSRVQTITQLRWPWTHNLIPEAILSSSTAGYKAGVFLEKATAPLDTSRGCLWLIYHAQSRQMWAKTRQNKTINIMDIDTV